MQKVLKIYSLMNWIEDLLLWRGIMRIFWRHKSEKKDSVTEKENGLHMFENEVN